MRTLRYPFNYVHKQFIIIIKNNRQTTIKLKVEKFQEYQQYNYCTAYSIENKIFMNNQSCTIIFSIMNIMCVTREFTKRIDYFAVHRRQYIL